MNPFERWDYVIRSDFKENYSLVDTMENNFQKYINRYHLYNTEILRSFLSSAFEWFIIKILYVE